MEALSTFFTSLQKLTGTLRSDTVQSQEVRDYSHDATALAKLESDISSGNTTHTKAITAAYSFNQQHHDTLVTMTGQFARERFLEKDSTKREQLSSQYEDSKAAMKQARKFNRFAENVVSQDTLQGKPNIISGENKQRELSWSYKKDDETYGKFENTLDSDKDAYLNGTGITLNPRIAPEQIDPQHRAWGTRVNAAISALGPVYDNWVGGTHEKADEDLTVAIELSGVEKDQVAIKNKYFTPQEAMAHIVTSDNGILYDCHGKKVDTCLDSNGNKKNPGDDYYIFVMDMEGNLFIHPDNKYFEEADGTKKRIGHPAFAQGGRVVCAGSLIVKEGKITTIDSNSGHYSPKSYSLFRVVSELHNRGVLTDTCRITSYGDERITFNQQDPSASTIDKVQIPPSDNAPDLSEQHNPLKLLESLTKVNLYLKDRAEETSFLGSWGRNYSARKEHFQSVLAALSNGNHQGALNLINEGIEKFDGAFTKNRYASRLEELRDSLTGKDGLLNNNHVRERVGAYRAVYEAMNNYTSAVSDYNTGYSPISDDSTAQAILAERNIHYLAKRKAFADIRKEFPNDKELRDTAYNNVAHR